MGLPVIGLASGKKMDLCDGLSGCCAGYMRERRKSVSELGPSETWGLLKDHGQSGKAWSLSA